MAESNGSFKLEDVMFTKNRVDCIDAIMESRMPDVVRKMNESKQKIESVEDWLECTEV